jgi:carboxylate-amine ligase
MKTDAGCTVGVEEEYHLLDAHTLALANRPALSAQAHDGRHGPGLRAEMLTSQLEGATDPCTDLDQLRAGIIAMRARAAAVAGEHGAVIMASSTHPFARLAEVQLADEPRYAALVERFGPVVHQFNLCGAHVHVRVPDLEDAVAIMNHTRPYLPLLAALTGSSPFHQGVDTGYASFRLSQLALWPQGGLPPYLSGAASYRSLVAELVRTGIVTDPTMLLWELRPSARYPTLEFRIGDVCTEVEDVVLHAGLVRSLVRVLAARAAAGSVAPPVPDPVLRAARWRAARYGLGGTLWSAHRGTLVPAASAVDELWSELEPDLVQHGEADALWSRLTDLRTRGTSATRQRRVYASTGSLQQVVRDAVALTNRRARSASGVPTVTGAPPA